MVYKRTMLITLLCLSCIISSAGRADDADIPMRELLLMQDIPVVITPAKVEQSILESPSTITVLTREDIRRYGLNSFSGLMSTSTTADTAKSTADTKQAGL